MFQFSYVFVITLYLCYWLFAGLKPKQVGLLYTENVS
jgi:hypothetical protein